MAFVTNTRRIEAGITERIAQIFHRVITRAHNHRVYRKTLAELSVLGPNELADIGLHRANIRSAAYQAAYK